MTDLEVNRQPNGKFGSSDKSAPETILPARAGCTEKCWTPVACPDHGDLMTPVGRSAGESFYRCCDNYAVSSLNPRHLWSEHDSTRHYTDPEGWAEHERTCDECNPQEDD